MNLLEKEGPLVLTGASAALFDAIAGTGRLMLDAAAERLAPLSAPALERALERRRALFVSELEETRGLPPNEAAAEVDKEISVLRDRVATLQAAESAVLQFLGRPGRLKMLDVVAGEVPADFDLVEVRTSLHDRLHRLARRLLDDDDQELAVDVADRLLARVTNLVIGRRQVTALSSGRSPHARRKRQSLPGPGSARRCR